MSDGRRYFSRPTSRADLCCCSLINERVDIRLEAIDHRATLVSIAVAPAAEALREGKKGVAVALYQDDLVKLRDCINSVLGKR